MNNVMIFMTQHRNRTLSPILTSIYDKNTSNLSVKF